MSVYLNSDGLQGVSGSGLTNLGNTRWYIFGVGNPNNTAVTYRYEMFDTQTTGQQTFYYQLIFGRGGGQQQRANFSGVINTSSYPSGTGGWWHYNTTKQVSGFTTIDWLKSGTKIYLDLRSSTTAIGSGHLFLYGAVGRIYPTFTGLTSQY